MTIQILVSCMDENPVELEKKLNLENFDALIVNQCNVKKEEIIHVNERLKVVNSNETGLSNSRNKAIENSDSDICVIADNDSIFLSDAQKTIDDAYKMFPDADIIVFNERGKFAGKPQKLKRAKLLRVNSRQITFKRKSIISRICFDNKIGAGTDVGSGEDTKFIIDAYRKKLKLYSYPKEIIKIPETELYESTWFEGFNESYFYRRGMVTRYIFGLWQAVIYSIYFALTKRNLYKEEISAWSAFFNMLKGIAKNEIEKQSY